MTLRLVPAIDIRGGRCVRLRQGRFDEVTRYSEDPVELAAAYVDAGATHLHVVDLDGCLEGRPRNLELISAITSLRGLRVQVGGGLRNRDSIDACLEAGTCRVVLGSAAFTDLDECVQWLREYGPDRLVLAADIRLVDGVPLPAINGWREDSEIPLDEVLTRLSEHGLRRLLCTDIARDGMMRGPNVDLYRRLVERWPLLAIQASGGVRSTKDLLALERAGARTAIVGKSLLDGTLDIRDARQWLQPAA